MPRRMNVVPWVKRFVRFPALRNAELLV